MTKKNTPIKRTPKVEKKPLFPGRRCPDCGEVYMPPEKNPDDPFWHYTELRHQEVPHGDSRDCIRYLRKQFEDLRSSLKESFRSL